ALQPYLSVPVGNSLASLLRYGLSRDVVYIHNPPNVFVAAKEPSMGLLLGGGLDLRVPKEDDDLGIPSAEESEQDTTAVLDEPPVIKIQEHADPETADASDSEAPPTLVPFTPVKSTSVLTKPVDPRKAPIATKAPVQSRLHHPLTAEEVMEIKLDRAQKQMGVITDEPLPQVTTVPAAAPAPKPQVCKFKTLDLKTIPQWDPTWNGTKSDVRAFLGTMRDARRRLTASSSRPITIESIRDIWLHAVKTLGGDGVELAEGFRVATSWDSMGGQFRYWFLGTDAFQVLCRLARSWALNNLQSNARRMRASMAEILCVEWDRSRLGLRQDLYYREGSSLGPLRVVLRR
ncbi:hypothetical protein BGX31_004096, partial [Mortierella sp. GBA43]